MGFWISLAKSSLGRKYLMAITGVMMFGFLMAHALGNMLYFSGPSAINNYANGLKALPFQLLWIMRIVIFSAFILHILAGVSLWAENRWARPKRYVFDNTVQATFSSRTMIYTGLLIFVFVLYHIAHFTLQMVASTGEYIEAGTGHPDVFAMVQAGFHRPEIAVLYFIAMGVLLLHLMHGLASMFQSMGIRHRSLDFITDRLSPLAGWLVVAAFISLPALIVLQLR